MSTWRNWPPDPPRSSTSMDSRIEALEYSVELLKNEHSCSLSVVKKNLAATDDIKQLLARLMQKQGLEVDGVDNVTIGDRVSSPQRQHHSLGWIARAEKYFEEKLNAKIIQLEKHMEMKQKLELDIPQLKGTISVLKGIANDVDAEFLKMIDASRLDYTEKEQSLQDLEALIQTLIIKKQKINEEMQEARNELINGIERIPGHIGVKIMGEPDYRLFIKAMEERYCLEEAQDLSSLLCSYWEKHLKDLDWHPFEVVTIEGERKVIIKDDDEKLNELKKELGQEAYNSMVAALKERNEYDTSGRCTTRELWNCKGGRRATLREGVQFLLEQYKTLKRKRGIYN